MSVRARLFVAVLSTVVLAYVAVGSILGRVMGDSTYGQLVLFNEVVSIVEDSYVEPIDVDRTLNGARHGLTEALDGDSAYLDATEFAAWESGTRGGAADVGALLTRRFSFLAVVSVRPGSPAERAGLRAGDILKTLDGRHTRSIAAPVGQRLLQGAPGTSVKVTVLRPASDPVDLVIAREVLSPVAITDRLLEDGTAVVELPEVSARTARDLRTRLEALQKAGMKRLVLDLRASALGDGTEAAEVVEELVKGGVVARLGGHRVAEQTFAARADRQVWDGPVAVLVGVGTAGPAEVVAAAVLAAERGPVVGRPTFGRAAVQKGIPLREGGLVLTVATFRTPKGDPIHLKGVKPSIVVEEETKDGVDPVLQKAIEALTAPPAAKAA